jgi:dynein heavy chain
MLFAVTWSLGASCDKAGRTVFDTFLRSKLSGADASELQLPAGALVPASASVYDWCFSVEVCGALSQAHVC